MILPPSGKLGCEIQSNSGTYGLTSDNANLYIPNSIFPNKEEFLNSRNNNFYIKYFLTYIYG